MKKLFLLLALMCMVVVGCSKDDVDKGNDNDIPENIFFGLDKDSVTISPDGGSVDVVVYNNYKWEISGVSDWCTPSVKKGDADEDGQKVTFSADVAYDDREATFWFRCADEKIKFVVTQKFKAVIIPDTNNSFNIPAEGGVAVISYQTSVDCEVVIPAEAQDWITIAPATRGLVAYNTTLNIAANYPNKQRSCVVKVVSRDYNELFAEYSINQNPRYSLYYTSSDGNIVKPYSSSAFDATILSNTYKDGVGIIEFNAPITKIGDWTFYDCSSLTSVTIPDSVTTIGLGAFQECSSLTNVTIPDSVTSIEVQAFSDCSSLTSVTIGSSVTTIGDWTFYDCSSLTSVTIPDSVTSIGNSAFSGCSSLTSVTIPDSVTTIGFQAFCGCSSLTSVTIPDSVTEIGEGAFYNCSSLTSVTIPDGVTTIGGAAFSGCSSLGEFNGKYASDNGRCLIIDGTLNSFAPAGLTEYTIPDRVTTIGDYAFQVCSSLTSVTIPDSVTAIRNYAFYGCSSLTSVTIGDSVTTIGFQAFYECSSLTSVTIGDSVTSIGKSAFSDCSSLTSVTIPDSVTTIGNAAFAGCSSLREFNGKYASEDGRCLIIDGALNSFAPAGLTEYAIPDSVTTIGEDAFFYCSSLISVTIGDSVTTIGECAFCGCSSLTSITIPDSVTSIGWSAFYGCNRLTSVYCKATVPPTAYLGGFVYWDAFDDNAYGRKIYVPTESVEAYKSAEGWSDYADSIVGYNF